MGSDGLRTAESGEVISRHVFVVVQCRRFAAGLEADCQCISCRIVADAVDLGRVNRCQVDIDGHGGFLRLVKKLVADVRAKKSPDKRGKVSHAIGSLDAILLLHLPFSLCRFGNMKIGGHMKHTEKLVLTHETGDLLYPVRIRRKISGRTAFHLVPPGGKKETDLYETEDVDEALELAVRQGFGIRCSTLEPTTMNGKGKLIKRAGLYSVSGGSIKNYFLKK